MSVTDQSSLTSTTDGEMVSGDSEASEEDDISSSVINAVAHAWNISPELSRFSVLAAFGRPVPLSPQLPPRRPAPSSSTVFRHPGGYPPALTLSGNSSPPQPQASITQLGKRPAEDALQEDPSNKKMKGLSGDEFVPFPFPFPFDEDFPNYIKANSLESTVSVTQMKQGLLQFFINYQHGLQNENINVGGNSRFDFDRVVNEFVQKYSLPPVVSVDELAGRIQDFGNKHQAAMRAADEHSKKAQHGGDATGSGTKNPQDQDN